MTHQTCINHLSLEVANRLIAASLAKGRDLGLKPLSVALLDAGRPLIAFSRDAAPTLRPQIAMGKAGGSQVLGV